MITFTANTRKARAVTDDQVTSSSVGIPVVLNLSDEFAGLEKTVVFRAGDRSADVVLLGDSDTIVVPAEVLMVAGSWLSVGVYAANSLGDIVIPTVWAKVCVISEGVVPSGVEPAQPAPSWAAQLQSIVEDAVSTIPTTASDIGAASIEDVLSAFPADIASGHVSGFSDGANDMQVKSLTVHINPVQSGSGDPAPDNVRQISGWTQVKLHHTGGNLLDFSKIRTNACSYTGTAQSFTMSNPTGTYPRVYFDISEFIGKGPLFLSCYAERSGGTFTNDSLITVTYVLDGSTKYDGITGAGRFINGISSTADAVLSIPEGATSARLNLYLHNSSTSPGENATITVSDLRICAIPGQSYTPYSDDTFTIPLGQTVYDGTLNVTTGVLTVTRAIVALESLSFTFNETRNWWRTSALSSVMVAPSNSGYMSDLISDHYNTATYNSMYNNPTGLQNVISVSSSGLMAVMTEGSAPEDSPVGNILYTLKNPVTYQLDPVEVKTMLGENNLWADTGDVDVEYRADVKLYIQKLTAPTEDDMTADANIESGKYFVVGNTLYLSNQSIASGQAIVPGTNCTRVSLADALNAINS